MIASMALLVSVALAAQIPDQCMSDKSRKINAWFQMDALRCCDKTFHVVCSSEDKIMCWCQEKLPAEKSTSEVSRDQGNTRGHFDHDDLGRLLFTNWHKQDRGYVCSDHFTDHTARVICDEQGKGVASWEAVPINPSVEHLTMDNLVCAESVTKFDDCNYLLKGAAATKVQIRGKKDKNGLGPDVTHFGVSWLEHKCKSSAGIILKCSGDRTLKSTTALIKDIVQLTRQDTNTPKDAKPESNGFDGKKKIIIFLVGLVVLIIITAIMCMFCYWEPKAEEDKERAQYATVVTNAGPTTQKSVPATHEAEEVDPDDDDSVEIKIMHSGLNLV